MRRNSSVCFDSNAKTVMVSTITNTHVHPYSLKWVVPDFLAGNRILKESDIKAPEKTPYMRDPLRFGPDGAYSYHGKGIMTGYLDGHVRYKIPVDDKADF